MKPFLDRGNVRYWPGDWPAALTRPMPPRAMGRWGSFATFSPSIHQCWQGLVHLIFKMRIRTDVGCTRECQSALTKILHENCPGHWGQARNWSPSTAQIGIKRMYLPTPEPAVYLFPHYHILGKLPLIPAGDHGTVPRSMHGRKYAAIHGAYAIIRVRQAWEVTWFTFTRGAQCVPGPCHVKSERK
jgi:hypothetical protein